MVDKLNNLINYIKVLTNKCPSKLNIRYGYQTKLKNDKKKDNQPRRDETSQKMYRQVFFTSREKNRRVTTASLI
jgi:hypothetical protein